MYDYRTSREDEGKFSRVIWEFHFYVSSPTQRGIFEEGCVSGLRERAGRRILDVLEVEVRQADFRDRRVGSVRKAACVKRYSRRV